MKPTLVRNSYIVGCYYEGRQYRRSARTGNKKAAERIQAQIDIRLEQIRNGLVDLPEDVDLRDFLLYGKTDGSTERDSPSVEKILSEYESTLAPPRISPGYVKTCGLYLGHLRRFLDSKEGDKTPESARDWKPEHVETYRNWRLSPAGAGQNKRIPRPLTLRKEIRFLGRAFEYARKRGWVDMDPTTGVDALPDTPPGQPYRSLEEARRLLEEGDYTPRQTSEILRCRICTPEEIEEMLALVREASIREYVAVPGDIALFMDIIAHTGMRRGEVVRLRRSDIDLDNRILTALSRKQSRTVSQTPRHIPVSDRLARLLAAWMKAHPGEKLFGDDAESKAWKDRSYRILDHITKGTKFHRLRPHILRHSMRSNLTMDGVDERVIDEILGHTTEEVARLYRHISAEKIRGALDIVDPPAERPDEKGNGDGEAGQKLRYSLLA